MIEINEFDDGIQRFIIGLSQKVLIANTLGTIVDGIWRQGAGALSWKTAWLGSVAYTMQIFFDFAGYSSMAIGIGKMLGFKFSENFNYPYISKSITEFWRRWHITLGEWFKQYLYIPLGGNRVGKARAYINLAIVFLLTGIWHGASWTFIVWGLMHGFFRLLEKFLSKKNILVVAPNWFKSMLGHLYLLFVVNIGWIFFRAPNLSSAVLFIKCMFGHMSNMTSGISVRYYLSSWNVLIIIIALLFSTDLPKRAAGKICELINADVFCLLKYISLLALLFISMIGIVTDTYQSFIYFQF